MSDTKVYTLEEAEKWFLSHSSGKVTCVHKGEEREVETYAEAVDFYNA